VDAETRRASSNRHFRQVDGQLIVASRGGAATEVGALYRNLAVLCIEQQVTRVLVKPCGADPVEEHALRVALTTMVLAGLPAGFRIALVADSDRVRARYLNTERDLRMAGVDAQMFPTEEGAAHWLRGVSAGPVPAPG
jgi:hypothetical protein